MYYFSFVIISVGCEITKLLFPEETKHFLQCILVVFYHNATAAVNVYLFFPSKIRKFGVKDTLAIKFWLSYFGCAGFLCVNM